jgi:hypothetical protein
MPTLNEAIRTEIKQQERHRAHYKAQDDRVDSLRTRLTREKHLKARLMDNRDALRKAIEKEARLDLKNQGVHSDEWEKRIADRIDEIADQVEVCVYQIDNVLDRVDKHRDLRQKFAKELEQDKDRLEVLRERRHNRQANSADQLTKDFHLSEFDCHNGVTVKSACPGIIPDLEALCKNHLQPLRDSGGTVAINSGYRTAGYNASIGGATQSYHIYDLRGHHPAADHIQAGRAASSVQAWHEGHNPFDGMGFYAGFTHGDDRGYHVRWYGAA